MSGLLGYEVAQTIVFAWKQTLAAHFNMAGEIRDFPHLQELGLGLSVLESYQNRI
jgi:hypothetical protein